VAEEALVHRSQRGGLERVRRWEEQNLFFGGVQAVARNPDQPAELSGRAATLGVAVSQRLFH